MKQIRLVPFDLEKAKSGAKLVTRGGRRARIGFFDLKNEDYPIVCAVEVDDGKEFPKLFTKTGKYYDDCKESLYDLFIEEAEDEQKRRMTYQELSWWLRDCPNEHREWMCKSEGDFVHVQYPYNESAKDYEVDANIYIRKNGGEWEEPLIAV